MARRFRGTSTNKVDAKGRVSIPASFRRVLEASDPDWREGLQPTVYLLHGDHRRPWIVAYSAAAMAEVDEQIDMMPRGSEARQRAEDYYYANATQLSVDDSGRLVLPKDLREMFRIGDVALFKSAGDTFKIMPPEADAPAKEGLRGWLEGQEESFDIASLLPPLPVKH